MERQRNQNNQNNFLKRTNMESSYSLISRLTMKLHDQTVLVKIYTHRSIGQKKKKSLEIDTKSYGKLVFNLTLLLLTFGAR